MYEAIKQSGGEGPGSHAGLRLGILAPVLTSAQHTWGVLHQFELAKGAQGAGQVAIGFQLASQFPIQLDQSGLTRAPDGTLGWPRETKRIGVGLPLEQKFKIDVHKPSENARVLKENNVWGTPL